MYANVVRKDLETTWDLTKKICELQGLEVPELNLQDSGKEVVDLFFNNKETMKTINFLLRQILNDMKVNMKTPVVSPSSSREGSRVYSGVDKSLNQTMFLLSTNEEDVNIQCEQIDALLKQL
ncbi:hypothetical protein QTN25_007014 [Entamoeba marina]